MGLVVFEGFDHYNNTGDLIARSGKLQWLSTANSNINAANRTGLGKSIQFGQAGFLFGTLSSNYTEIIVGFGMYMAQATQSGAQSTFNLTFGDGNTGQCFVSFVGSLAQVTFNRGGTNLWTSTLNQFAMNTWNWYEVKISISPSAGIFALRINGQPVVSLTGLNTQTTVNSWVNSLTWSGFPTISQWASFLDDIYINDTTTDPGLYPMNDFAGDVRCITLFANGNNSVQWTPLALSNWNEISETAFDGDTTYNFSATAGQEDTFNYGALPATVNAVIAVQVTGAYRKTAAGTPIVNQAIISAATEVYGGTIAVPNSYAYFTDIFKLDPNGSINWTATSVNSMKAGYKLISV